MTPRQRLLVRTTFDQIQPVAGTAASFFYARLFDLDPSLRALFTDRPRGAGAAPHADTGDGRPQPRRYRDARTGTGALGRRHVGYGVRAHHYPTVAVALIETLERGLGAAFTSDVRAAWVTVYWLLADLML